MKNDKCLSHLFAALAILLSDAMCASVAYGYCDLQWCGQYAGCSAPPSIALLYGIPYGAGIIICCVLAWSFHKKRQKSL